MGYQSFLSQFYSLRVLCQEKYLFFKPLFSQSGSDIFGSKFSVAVDIPISQGILKIPFQNILKYDYEIYSFLLFISMVQQNRVNIKVADALGVSKHFGRALWIFLIMVTLWLKLVIFGVSGHYLENLWK